jgi:general secretion pathway protein E/type IV pilus assembly protein PilB
VGCPRCAHSGYRGRQAVLEILPIDAELDALIGQGAPLDALRRHAQLQGFSPLADAARALALSGRTSLDEALRVVDLPPHRADED